MGRPLSSHEVATWSSKTGMNDYNQCSLRLQGSNRVDQNDSEKHASLTFQDCSAQGYLRRDTLWAAVRGFRTLYRGPISARGVKGPPKGPFRGTEPRKDGERSLRMLPISNHSHPRDGNGGKAVHVCKTWGRCKRRQGAAEFEAKNLAIGCQEAAPPAGRGPFELKRCPAAEGLQFKTSSRGVWQLRPNTPQV